MSNYYRSSDSSGLFIWLLVIWLLVFSLSTVDVRQEKPGSQCVKDEAGTAAQSTEDSSVDLTCQKSDGAYRWVHVG